MPSQLAAELGISHATVGRWLHGKDSPNTKSCRLLAKYSGIPLETILAIAGHLPMQAGGAVIKWPEVADNVPITTRRNNRQ